VRRRVPLVLALLLGAVLGQRADARLVDFLYVEPNVGTASGGHAALRFEDRVYHFQNVDGDWLRMERADADFFRYAYSVVENRTIHLSRIEVEDETFETLRRRFDALRQVERRHFATLEALHRDRVLLEWMGGGSVPPGSVEAVFALPGAGFFLPLEAGTGVSPDREAAPLARLRERIRSRHGEGLLARRMAELSRELTRLRPGAAIPERPVLSRDRNPPARYRFSERFADATLERLALEILASAPPLRPEVRRALTGEGSELTAAERRLLGDFAAALEERLVALPRSPRPDWGQPLLLGMARLLVIDESLRTGRWVVLDAFPADTHRIPASAVSRRSEFLAELLARAGRDLDAARTSLAQSDGLEEPDYGALEEAINRLLELRRAREDGREIRVHGGVLMPSRAATPPELVLPSLAGVDLGAALASARASEEGYEVGLRALYGYDLVRRNCATELFRSIAASFDAQESGVQLGGHVDPDRWLRFVPRLAFEAVNDHYRVAERAEIPSYRRTRLAEMVERESRLWVHLRESNTLTSSVYRPNDHDSLFLFFTDDAVLPRPIYGAVNLAAGVVEAATGLLRLPFDRGRALVAGARGVAFSLPELVFVNLRKGTLQYGPGETPRTRAKAIAAP
jgi:hypothetical protein